MSHSVTGRGFRGRLVAKTLAIVPQLQQIQDPNFAGTAIEWGQSGLRGVPFVFVSFRNPTMRKHMLCLMLGAAVVGCADPPAEGPTAADPTTESGGGDVSGAQLVKFTCPTMT